MKSHFHDEYYLPYMDLYEREDDYGRQLPGRTLPIHELMSNTAMLIFRSYIGHLPTIHYIYRP